MAIAGVSPHLSEWKQAQLSELGTLHCGQSPASGDVNTEGRGTPYVTGPEQWDGKILRRTKWTTDPRRIVPDGSIFITVKGAGVGKIFPGIPCAIGRDIYAFKPNDGVSPKFIEHALRLTVDQVLRHAVGDIPGLSKAHILNHQISLPGLVEQELIVAEIEKQFSRLDEAVANLMRVKVNLKRYRGAVLAAAVEGRLVPTEADLARREGRTYETGEQLLVQILKERRAAGEERKVKVRAKTYDDAQPLDTSKLMELPEGWAWVTFGQIAERITKGSSPNWQGFEYCASGIPFVRSQNVGWGETDLTNLTFLPPAFNEVEKKAVLKEGDLLLNIVGASIGRAAIVPKSVAGGNVNQAVALIRLTAQGARNRYVLIYLLSAYCQRRIHLEKVDVARANFSLEDIKAMPLALPPLAEQQRIVYEVEHRLSMTDAMEAQADASLRHAERLRQAILKQAFEGRLG